MKEQTSVGSPVQARSLTVRPPRPAPSPPAWKLWEERKDGRKRTCLRPRRECSLTRPFPPPPPSPDSRAACIHCTRIRGIQKPGGRGRRHPMRALLWPPIAYDFWARQRRQREQVGIHTRTYHPADTSITRGGGGSLRCTHVLFFFQRRSGEGSNRHLVPFMGKRKHGALVPWDWRPRLGGFLSYVAWETDEKPQGSCKPVVVAAAAAAALQGVRHMRSAKKQRKEPKNPWSPACISTGVGTLRLRAQTSAGRI